MNQKSMSQKALYIYKKGYVSKSKVFKQQCALKARYQKVHLTQQSIFYFFNVENKCTPT